MHEFPKFRENTPSAVLGATEQRINTMRLFCMHSTHCTGSSLKLLRGDRHVQINSFLHGSQGKNGIHVAATCMFIHIFLFRS
jgi:hypothetical protein